MGLDGYPWVRLTKVAAESVATVAACAAVGTYGRRQGVLTDSALRELDRLISSIYLPCLIFTKVLPNTSVAVLMDIWPLAVVCVCSVVYGLIAGALAGRGNPRFRGMLMVAVAFPNSFSVPLTLMLALGDLPELSSQAALGGESLGSRINFLFVMSYSLWTLARWSIGFPILTGALSFKEWRKKVVNPPVVACVLAFLLGLAWDTVPSTTKPTLLSWMGPVLHSLSTAFTYAGQCSVPSILMTLGAKLDEALVLLRHPRASVVLSEKLLATDAEGHSVPRRAGTLNTDAEGRILPRRKSVDTSTESEATLPLSSYFAVLVLRQLLGPIIGALVMLGLLRRGFGVVNPVVLLVGMLQTAGPPMINLAVMSGLSRTAEKETARLLLLTYSCSIVTWTLSIALFLALL